MTEEKATYDVTYARKALEEDREERVRQCKAAIEAALELYKCQILVLPKFTEDGRVGTVTTIAATE